VYTHPWVVCVAMHEYARNLYPTDPYIQFKKAMCPTERLYAATKNTISFLDHAQLLGYYKICKEAAIDIKAMEIKRKTGNIYGNLWSKFSFRDLADGAYNILHERFVKNNFDASFLKGKRAIDIGCGSGRYTFALKKLGCNSVVGVDYGDKGLKIAKATLKKTKISGIKFLKRNVLEIPFSKETFDFVFCNGVLHHTEDMEHGIGEMIRIAKKGGKLWLYLYGDGGIFWYARKKMPLIMKKIPQQYTMAVLDIIGMPPSRFIFCDNWYVPIERHTTDTQARKILKRHKITKVFRLERGCSTDLEYCALHRGKVGKIMWGDGELRYILEK